MSACSHLVTQVGALNIKNQAKLHFIYRCLYVSIYYSAISNNCFPLRVKNKPYDGVSKMYIYSWTGHGHGQQYIRQREKTNRLMNQLIVQNTQVLFEILYKRSALFLRLRRQDIPHSIVRNKENYLRTKNLKLKKTLTIRINFTLLDLSSFFLGNLLFLL